MFDDEDKEPRYAVVINEEGDRLPWRHDRPLPEGWGREGFVGTKRECLVHINRPAGGRGSAGGPTASRS